MREVNVLVTSTVGEFQKLMQTTVHVARDLIEFLNHKSNADLRFASIGDWPSLAMNWGGSRGN
jgi:hypothetical protein